MNPTANMWLCAWTRDIAASAANDSQTALNKVNNVLELRQSGLGEKYARSDGHMAGTTIANVQARAKNFPNDLFESMRRFPVDGKNLGSDSSIASSSALRFEVLKSYT